MRRPVSRLARPRIRAELDATSRADLAPHGAPPLTHHRCTSCCRLVACHMAGVSTRSATSTVVWRNCVSCTRLSPTDMARRPPVSALLVHLGDYIDFGPDSAGVVALLAAGAPVAGLQTINLMGDHERTALQALSGEAPPRPIGCTSAATQRFVAGASRRIHRAPNGARIYLPSTSPFWKDW